MLYDFLDLNRQSGEPLYLQLYRNVKEAVEEGRLQAGQRLPSIRKLSEDLRLSRTTIEAAYQQLGVEGYIISRPQSGYYVMEETRGLRQAAAAPIEYRAEELPKGEVEFHLSTDCIDSRHADMKLWRKHVKDILGRQEIIAAYGEPQGERELREALSAYSHGARGVSAPPQAIVIGAGTQPLLYLLCGLLDGSARKVAMEQPGFPQAEQVFHDCGVETMLLPADRDGISMEALWKSGAGALWVNPSSRFSGRAIPMSRRLQLLEWAEQTGGLILEDDYNGELRYRARPIPALQSQDSRNVVYLGSFSKLLLPSVRIGYMILPPALLQSYQARAHRYNQTASKIEQLALARYIREGQLERQLRRLRKLYAEKSTLLTERLQLAFGGSIELVLQETALCLHLTMKNGMDSQQLVDAAYEKGVRLMPAKSRDETSFGQVLLGFAGIPVQDIPDAVDCLKSAWLPEK